MVTLIEKLKYLYPTAEALLFGVSDGNNGQEVTNWRQSFPQPSQSELDAVADEDVNNYLLDVEQSGNRVNRYQIRMGLKEIGQLANVKSVYAALPTDHDIIILWSNDVDFARNGIFAMDMKSRFGLTDANLDNLWTKAAVYKS